MRIVWLLVGLSWLGTGLLATAQEIAPIARRLPPAGIEIPVADREQLKLGVVKLAGDLKGARSQLAGKATASLLPDVEIYQKAVQYALDGEFFSPGELKQAFALLEQGKARLDAILADKIDWATSSELVVRGYRSDLDDSVQPYGLVLPKPFDATKVYPLYVWLHGRGDKNTELSFIVQRQAKVGEMKPEGAIVLHVFGRHCNAFKFAGEVDVFEAIGSVFTRYKIDPDKIVLCGFSMGGAGAWHLGAHYPTTWCAVSPGAGFAETAKYQKLMPDKYPEWYVQKLWGWYDAPNYVRNLFNIPVVAYSGELDKQIQAARVMEEAFAKEGRTLTHLIGPGVAHKYNPETLKELQGVLAKHVAESPRKLSEMSLQTRTLRYNKAPGVEALGLKEHWKDSRIDVKLDRAKGTTNVMTRDVTAFRLFGPTTELKNGSLTIDGQDLSPKVFTEDLTLAKIDGKWTPVRQFPLGDGLRKTHGLQGPIDDVFFEPFLVVTPSGKSANPAVQRWVDFELAHFKDRWRRIFRGEFRVKEDDAVTPEDMKKYHLIVWGDPASNTVLTKVAEKLPIRWTGSAITAGDKSFPATGHVVSMIYPNPLQPNRYVVVNSGPTFREGHDSTNSQQTPKLPDWAVIDLSEPPDAFQSGKIADAGFFDEEWKYQAKRE